MAIGFPSLPKLTIPKEQAGLEGPGSAMLALEPEQ